MCNLDAVDRHKKGTNHTKRDAHNIAKGMYRIPQRDKHLEHYLVHVLSKPQVKGNRLSKELLYGYYQIK